ncbi:MAG: RluA family pseudouridine synthase [Saprospiraceae bacterium]
MSKQTHTVPSDLADKVRLRQYLVGVFVFLETGNAVKKAIRNEDVTINGKLGYSGDWINANDVIVYDRPEMIKARGKQSKDTKIETLFENDQLIIVRKPAGLSSSGMKGKSLQRVLYNYKMGDAEDELEYPLIIHRLDRQTEGLIIAAKTMSAKRLLDEMLANHQIEKHYLALVEGEIAEDISMISTDVDGKKASTEILNSEKTENEDVTSLLKIRLHTGRTHQIRIHVKEIGHPIVGDTIYNPEGLNFGRGMMLSANYLKFEDPVSNEIIEIEAPVHKKFRKYLQLS